MSVPRATTVPCPPLGRGRGTHPATGRGPSDRSVPCRSLRPSGGLSTLIVRFRLGCTQATRAAVPHHGSVGRVPLGWGITSGIAKPPTEEGVAWRPSRFIHAATRDEGRWRSAVGGRVAGAYAAGVFAHGDVAPVGVRIFDLPVTAVPCEQLRRAGALGVGRGHPIGNLGRGGAGLRVGPSVHCAERLAAAVRRYRVVGVEAASQSIAASCAKVPEQFALTAST